MWLESKSLAAWKQSERGITVRREQTFVSDGNIWIAVIVSWIHMYVSIHQTVYFKYVWFITCQLYLNLLKSLAELLKKKLGGGVHRLSASEIKERLSL